MLAYILGIILFVLYVRKAISVSRSGDVVIVQLPARSLNDTILLEKNPIIVQDPVPKLNRLVGSSFRFLYLFRSEGAWSATHATTVRTRFCLLHNVTEGERLLHIGRDEQASSTIPVTIPPGCVAILPAGWHYRAETEEPGAWRVVLLNDLFHRLFF